MTAVQEREWYPPRDDDSSPETLRLYNSLNDKKVPFVPSAGPRSKHITWYTCGPTVYDSAHMGHARNYVSFDIVRRVLEDYFGYHCLFVMNVTDVDDKIILRARRNYLLERYKAEDNPPEKVVEDGKAAVNEALEKQEKKIDDFENQIAEMQRQSSKDPRKLTELTSVLEQEELKCKRHREAAGSLGELGTRSTAATTASILDLCGSYIAEALDGTKGKDVTDQSIFRSHAAKYEAEFMEDMASLGCRLPDAFTRVSEYIPEIVEYIEGIMRQGFGYEANGSVYFDTQSYRQETDHLVRAEDGIRKSGHVYGKLKPWAVGSATLAAEGESNFETSEKRHPSDFALWKCSKGGEPEWESPWGKGRPGHTLRYPRKREHSGNEYVGWHIECSAMASAIIGDRLDIHSGGEDLKFPHHDNELAQAEAYFHSKGCRQWVNYFLHSGHLSIEGLKMSKSLKNFVTIRCSPLQIYPEALTTFSARQIRLLFVLQQWNRPMAYGESSREEVKSKEAALKNFFQNISVAIRDRNASTVKMKWEEAEVQLEESLTECQRVVHTSLCDNVNTRGAMDAVLDCIKAVNIYLSKKQSDTDSHPHPFLLTRIAGYVTKILSAFGIVESPGDGMGMASTEGTSTAGSAYLNAFSSFRDEIRSLARGGADAKELLNACDRVRDTTLVDLGIRLEDTPTGKAVWKLDDPDILRAEIEEKRAAADEQAEKKIRNKIELKLREKERFEKAFELPSKYSQYDPETGAPTHGKDGNPLEGKALDNARKDFEKIKKRRAPVEAKLSENPQYLIELNDEIAALRQSLGSGRTDCRTEG